MQARSVHQNRMAAFAIIGATGRTGRQILQILAQNSANTVTVYVRSQKKLESLFPNIVEQKHVQIFVGSIDDTDLLARCIQWSDYDFCHCCTSIERPSKPHSL